MTGDGIDSGFCYDIHTFSFARFTCLGTGLSLFNAAVCFLSFGYCLNKMQSNHRRALAGYTKNTINIDIHMNLMMYVAIWCLIWAVYELFDLADDVEDNGLDDLKYRRLFGLTRGMIFGYTSFLESAVLLLLCSPSVGVNAFRTYWGGSTFWGVTIFLTICVSSVYRPGESNKAFYYRNYVFVIVARAAITIAFNVFTLWYFGIRSSGDRPAVIRYSNYLICLYSSTMIGNLCLTSRRAETANFGLCLVDLTEIIHFGTFASFVYLALKRDCQYWSSGFGDEEEEEKMTFVMKNDEITWSELPNYKDVVIPKTELFFRSKLRERLDITVETHLWRRRVVVVKRFRFDFLTKDNIKYFKKEANIFKVLNHDYIVKFFGVLIDPPSLGIVMQYGVNGDLFENLEKIRKEYILSASNNNASIPPRQRLHKKASIRLDQMYCKEEVEDISFANSSVAQMNPMLDGRDRGSGDNFSEGGSDDNERAISNDRDRERSTINWSSEPRQMRMSTRIVQTLSSATGGSRNNLGSSSSFEPLICMHQVVQGMSYLHSQNVTHSDLKSLNVLLDEDYNAKITDFGESSFEKKLPNRSSASSVSSTGGTMSFFNMSISSSKPKSSVGRLTSKHSTSTPDQQGEPVGTPGWAAPEAIEGRATRASDVFGFGTMLWEVLTWRPPSVLLSIDMLREEPLCFMPTVITAVYEYCEASKQKNLLSNSLIAKREAQNSDDDMFSDRDSIQMSRMSSPGVGTSYSVDSGAHMRERKKADFKEASKARRPSMDNCDLSGSDANQKNTLTSVFTKFGPSAQAPTSPHIMGSVEEMTKNMNGDEKILIEVSDMEFAYETMCVRGLRPPMPIDISPELGDLLKTCWDFEIKKRPTFPQILSAMDRYFKQNPEPITGPLELSNELNYCGSSVLHSDNC